MSIILGIFLAVLAVIFLREMRHNIHRSAVSGHLINKYRDDYENPALYDELYEYMASDYKLKKIVARYNVTCADVAALSKKLKIWGDFHKDRRYVPVSAFFYVCTLEYIVANKDGDPKKLTEKCMNYFHM